MIRCAGSRGTIVSLAHRDASLFPARFLSELLLRARAHDPGCQGDHHREHRDVSSFRCSIRRSSFYLGLIPAAFVTRAGSGSSRPTCSCTRADAHPLQHAGRLDVRRRARADVGNAVLLALLRDHRRRGRPHRDRGRAAAVRRDCSRPTCCSTIGASGALYGLLLAFAMYYPGPSDPDVPALPGAGEVLRHDPRRARVPRPTGQRGLELGAPGRAGVRLPVSARRPRRASPRKSSIDT